MTALVARCQAMWAARDRGATTVEYAFMVMLIALAIIVAVAALGGKLSSVFGSVPDKIPIAV